MPVPAPDVSKVVYRVSRPDTRRLHVEADITPAAPVSVLTLRERYGPAQGFPLGISNVTVTGGDARAAIAPGKLLVVSSVPFTLTYDCTFPDYVDAVSLLRGFRRNDTLFAPGMALFHRLHDQRAEYEVNIETAAACSRPADENGRLLFGTERELERAYFAFGDVVIDTAGETRFVHEPTFPFAIDDALKIWPRLAHEISQIFGDDRASGWTVFLFSSHEHQAGQPGVGFALPGGALVSVSADDGTLASAHTLWLLLHERAHQWLGEALGRADPADDWFFEGFTNFTACEVLARAGLLPTSERERLLALSRRAARRLNTSDSAALAHRGFLCAERWHRHLLQHGSSLTDVLVTLVATHRGKTLQGEDLIAALCQASTDGKAPDFPVR